MFSTQITLSPFVRIFDIISLFAVEFGEPKIGISGKGLKNTESDYRINQGLKVLMCQLKKLIIWKNKQTVINHEQAGGQTSSGTD